jgi:hypothetical protein
MTDVLDAFAGLCIDDHETKKGLSVGHLKRPCRLADWHR